MANTHYFALVMLVVAGTLILSDYRVSAQCGVDVSEVLSRCEQYVTGPGPNIPPSAGCCAVVKTIDFSCACKNLDPELEKLLNMDKVVFVGRTCGLTIPAGTKCGSYTVPPGLRI